MDRPVDVRVQPPGVIIIRAGKVYSSLAGMKRANMRRSGKSFAKQYGLAFSLVLLIQKQRNFTDWKV